MTTTCPRTSTSARRARCAPTWTRHSSPAGAQRRHGRTRHNVAVAIEFSQRIRRIPTYPAAGGYAQHEPLVRLASNESPYPPLPAVRDAIERALGTLNRYPDPSNSLLRRRLSDRYGVPVVADRDRQRLVRHPARRRRGAARAGRRARVRVAVVLGLSASQRRLGRARGDGRARPRTSATTSRRCCARSPSPRGW